MVAKKNDISSAISASKFYIIRDAADLNRGIAFAKKAGEQYHTAMHILAVSVLVHAAEGGVQPLQAFDTEVLSQNVNMRTAFTQYVRAFQTVMVDGKATHSDMRFLEYTKKTGWVLIRGTNDERKKFIEHAEANLINPDGENYHRFYEKDVIKEARRFDNAEVLKKAKALQSAIEKHGQEVDDEVYLTTKAFVTNLETFVGKHAAAGATVH